MDFLAALRERNLVLDGAMGSELLARGFSTRECPELWNVSNPDIVADIHRGYFAAGSDVVHTNTFGGSRPKLAAYHCQERTQELNEAGARLAVAVRDEVAPGRFVAGDVGSAGRLLKPMGDMDPRELEEVFAEQVEALARGGVDLVSIETMFDLEEARLAVKATREVSRLPVSASMTFNRTPKGYRTMMGVTPQQAVETLLAEGADVVGTNCTLTAFDMIELVGDLRRATDGPLLAEPNAGQPRLQDGHTVYEESAEHFAEGAVEIVAQGADLIGGCCGTDATFIATLVAGLGR
jgi:5-methyltetrahydrofolate--homocysteine methyltransferase